MEYVREAKLVNVESPTWPMRNPDEFYRLPKYRKVNLLKYDVFDFLISGGKPCDVIKRFGPLVSELPLKRMIREAEVYLEGYKKRVREEEKAEKLKEVEESTMNGRYTPILPKEENSRPPKGGQQ